MSRLILLFIGGWFLALGQVHSEEASSWKLEKQFSADVVMTLKSGNTHAFKLYFDADKHRFEFAADQMNMVQIVRARENKFYNLMPAQKMCVEMPNGLAYTPDHILLYATNDAKFELIGPDTVEGKVATKYRMIGVKKKAIYYWWIDSTTLAPMKVSTEDGSLSMVFKNFKAGPQEASLFEPPASYQMVQMTAGTTAPGEP